jgi:hypothetical protein
MKKHNDCPVSEGGWWFVLILSLLSIAVLIMFTGCAHTYERGYVIGRRAYLKQNTDYYRGMADGYKDAYRLDRGMDIEEKGKTK